MRIYGETVSVSYRVWGAQDEYGNDAEEYTEPEDVENVLVGTGEQEDLIESGRPYAFKADKRFCFPRGFAKDLRGALVRREGTVYKIVGDPTSITDANIPAGIDWNIKAEAVVYDG